MNRHSPHILSIGQCQIDGPWIKQVLENDLGAVVDEAGSAAEALAKARQHRYGLILINRELARDNSSGLDLVAELVTIKPPAPVMLVSDYEDAQEAAVQRGALPGFGKGNFETNETLERLKKIVHAGHTSDAHPSP